MQPERSSSDRSLQTIPSAAALRLHGLHHWSSTRPSADRYACHARCVETHESKHANWKIHIHGFNGQTESFTGLNLQPRTTERVNVSFIVCAHEHNGWTTCLMTVRLRLYLGKPATEPKLYGLSLAALLTGSLIWQNGLQAQSISEIIDKMVSIWEKAREAYKISVMRISACTKPCP